MLFKVMFKDIATQKMRKYLYDVSLARDGYLGFHFKIYIFQSDNDFTGELTQRLKDILADLVTKAAYLTPQEIELVVRAYLAENLFMPKEQVERYITGGLYES